jgi:signal transduction histidine kinase
MPSGGKLEVTTQEKAEHFIVTIEDTGTGVDDKDVTKMADPFFTTKTYGTGLGLTLVEQILELHDAGFSLKQGDGGGMTATISFKKSLPE